MYIANIGTHFTVLREHQFDPSGLFSYRSLFLLSRAKLWSANFPFDPTVSISSTFYEQLFAGRKIEKKSDNLTVSFYEFGIFACKSCSYKVYEIHPDGIYEESFIEERRSNLEGFVNK